MTDKKNEKKVADQVFPIVGIGASAGGLDAMKQLLEELPEEVGLAFVVVQHLASDQKSMLPEILSRHTKMPVQKVQNEMNIEPNHIYVIPSGKTMTISKAILKLEPKTGSYRPINEFFESLAHDRKTKAIGVILSGTGVDGTEGLKAIKAEGGITLVQDPKTASYPDMPRSAIMAETVYYILSPKDIAKELVNISKHPEIARKKIEAEELIEDLTDNQKIFAQLKKVYGVNFSNYKKTTINRRIARRMVINKINRKKDYVKFLRKNNEELQALFDDLLIGVTSFFREPETFFMLKKQVFPELIEQKQPDEIIRIWVPGCSTGEEAYSIAIALEEFLEENNVVNKQIQIFGTDISEKFIEKARRAIYPKTIEENVSQKRLNRFFVPVNGTFQVKKQIRDMCVFAKHDLSLDPPFSNLDLIVCRNLLIYFDIMLQRKILPVLHYGLRNSGYLVLGQSESVGRFTNLYKPLTNKGVIFQKKEAQPTIEFPLDASQSLFATQQKYEHPIKANSLSLLRKEVDELLLSEYVFPALLLNNNLDVIVFRGDVDPYISVDSGVASFNVTKIVRKKLRPIIQTALYRAKKEKKQVEETVHTEEDEKTKTIHIQIKPIKLRKHEEIFFLIIFKETAKITPIKKTVVSSDETESTKDEQIRDLSDELSKTKQTLQTVVEQQEATNEELRSSLEEAQSANEELMSTNEELETTKEELQSANEELTTLNDELKNRNQSLSELNDDLSNLMNSIDTSVIIIDNEYKIRRFTDSAQDLIRLMPADLGRSITDIRLGIPIDNLEMLLSRAIDNLETVRKEIETEKELWYQMRIRPYLTQDKKVGGAILSLADITELKELEKVKTLHTENLEEKVKEQSRKLIESESLAAIGATAGMIGHDIRNPLQAIEGELYLTKQEIDNLSDSKEKTNMQQSLKRIQNRLHYINKIVVDLQDYSKKLHPSFQKVNLENVLNEVLKSNSDTGKHKFLVSVDFDLPKLMLDKSYLARIFTNLITNAIQATPDGGKITIEAFHKNNKAVISIKDNGDGMSEETKKKLFTPLFTTKAKGQGFGLAVVKRLAEAMGGNISFESEINQGSTFTLEFPLNKKN